MEDVFEFDEQKHVYTLNGKRLYGVTTVLGVINKPALVGWAAKMVAEHIQDNAEVIEGNDGGFAYVLPFAMLEEAKGAHRKKKDDAATKGTDVHALCEEYVKDMIATTNGQAVPLQVEDKMLQQFINWAVKEKVRFLGSERKLYSKEMWVAGTVDLLFEKGGKRYVGDIKTTSGIYDRTPFFQCAGYEMMLEEAGEAPFDGGRCIIRLGKDGSFDVTYSDKNLVDIDGFLSALSLFKALEVPVSEKQKHIKRAVQKKKHGS